MNNTRTTPRSKHIDRHIGTRLRELRAINGLSQKQLARELGVSFQQVQKYEQGTNRISASRLWEISEVMDVAPGTFFEGLFAELD